MNADMMEALENIEREKGISVEVMLEALANALVTAYKRLPASAEEALVEIDIETGAIRVVAQELDEEGNVTREWDDTPDDFGRIAAQTAKQVILQRIREAEREMKYEEYAGVAAQGVHRRGAQDGQGTADRRFPNAPRPGEAALRARGT
jgi:N utilization substance protein A